MNRRGGTHRLERRSRPGVERRAKADVAGGGGVTGVRVQQRSLGTKSLHQRTRRDARRRGDRTQRQLRRPAAPHDPHQCREHIDILCLTAPWTHLVLDIN